MLEQTIGDMRQVDEFINGLIEDKKYWENRTIALQEVLGADGERRR